MPVLVYDIISTMKHYSFREALPAEAQDNLKAFQPLLSTLLYTRGINSEEAARRFLNPSYETDLHDPYLMKDMDKAIERICRAISNQERILIYSDYDADGIPAAVIMSDFFKLIGYANVEIYIPHRHNEGFGLHLEAVDSFKDRVKLLITLDCGIVDCEEVDRANEHGIDVIITDHHLPGKRIPAAYAVVDAKQETCRYPFDELCGSGVAFKLVQALIQKGEFKIAKGAEKWILDMVGLATLSDMVPLQGENRALAHYGLKVLRKTRRPGLRKLLRKLNINPMYLTEDDIGFMISPRINAASRMGIPLDAFKLLSTDDEVEAGALATHLDSINNERKGIVASLVKESRKIILERKEHYESQPVIVLGNPAWRPALLGLVANSLVEDHGKPVFLWGREEGKDIKGSCRSDGSIHLVKLMERVQPLFKEFGGHTMSGGFSVHSEKIHVLEDELVGAYAAIQASADGETEKDNDEEAIDARLTLDDINQKTYDVVNSLAPFGIGNPKPIFMFENIVVDGMKQFGKGSDHIELSFLNSQGRKVRAIGFFKQPEDFSYKPLLDRPINLIAHLEKSYFMNRPELRLRIVDIV
jgi:single-stranded-DNA-specific exonuclease